MKFLCLDCDEVMEFAERQIPGDGTLAAVFKCGSCDREMAMLTNPMETQLVSSMGVKIGGREVPTQPMELARTSLEGGRDDAFVFVGGTFRSPSGRVANSRRGRERRRGRRGPHCVDVGGHRPARTSAQLRPGNGEADLHRLGTREGRFGDHARKHGPGSRGVGPGRYVGLFGATELSFTYPSGRKGLGKVSLKGAPGDRVVVMGPNGSGKSTLLRLVSTELPSRPGTLELFGEACGPTRRDFRKKRELRKRIGIVQDTSVHVEDLTGMENGLLCAELYGLPRTEALEAFAALFTSLGLDDALHVPTREYSYGMKKKLLIAEALVHDPDLLIMDEPALGLDPPSRVALRRILEERSGKGVCTLAATNEPALARELATTVVLLHEGEVVAHGSPRSFWPRSAAPHESKCTLPVLRRPVPQRLTPPLRGLRLTSCRSDDCPGGSSPRADRVPMSCLNWSARSSRRG